MTRPNAELAYKVLDQIDAHPETWNQSSWACGTTACFAGWAVRLSGGEIEQVVEQGMTPDVIAGPDEILGLPVDEAATKLLRHDCTTEDADDVEDLFDPFWKREDLTRIVGRIFGPRPRAWTPDEKLDDGGTRITVKRACNGCGELIGDVTEAEMDRAIAGLPAEDVRSECPRCRGGAS